MCGIGGVLTRDQRPFDPAAADRMLGTLEHRGRSASSRYRDAPVELLCARHAVIAPRTAHQPIYSAGGRYVLVGNGEIYNHRDLRRELPQAVRAGLSDGDLCVALELFAAYGPSGLDRLRGPFALAVWDTAERELCLCRDRLGEKPLYYFDDRNLFMFASEVRAIESAIGTRTRLDEHAMLSLLAIGKTVGQSTLLKDVFAVPPGGILRVRDRGTQMTFMPELPFRTREAGDWSDIDDLISQANDRVLVADRPIAIAFSGGTDSTAILSHARTKIQVAAVITLTAADCPRDENAVRARAVAQALDTELIEVPFLPPPPLAVSDTLMEHFDGPAAEMIVMHNDAIHEAAGHYAPVMLAGNGADEVFGGYERYARIRQWAEITPQPPWHDLQVLLDQVPDLVWGRLGRALRGRAYARLIAAADLEYDLNSSPTYRPFDLSYVKEKNDFTLFAQWLDLFELNTYDNFRVGDENGLSRGVELRSPYYDLDLITAVFSLATSDRVATGASKHFLKQRMKNAGVSRVLDQAKLGFDSFFDYYGWIASHRGALREAIRYGPIPKLGLIRPAVLSRLYRSDRMLQSNWRLVWRLFALSVWLERHQQYARQGDAHAAA